MQKINWYPGHMKKTKELIGQKIRLVDVIVELIDARAPLSSKNPLIGQMLKGYANKKHLLVITKADLVDINQLNKWVKHYEAQGLQVIKLNIAKDDLSIIPNTAKALLADVFEREKKKGLRERPFKMMILGVPNVGKSTLINRYAKRKAASVADKPGHTKSEQWININKKFELLDMPGLLWPKIEDPRMGYNLALINSINNDIINAENLVLRMFELISQKPGLVKSFCNYYKIENSANYQNWISEIAKAKKWDDEHEDNVNLRIAKMVLNDYQNKHSMKIIYDDLINWDISYLEDPMWVSDTKNDN